MHPNLRRHKENLFASGMHPFTQTGMTTPPSTRRAWLATTVAACAATAAFSMQPHLSGAADSPASSTDNRTFELRIYVTNEGKLPDLLARFRDHTVKLFEKHGIENIGYWVPLEKAEGSDNTLYYMIAHKSREGADASWAAFRKDPEWQAAAKASEANGKILAQKPDVIFLKATDFSCPIKTVPGTAERVFELRTYTTPEGRLPALHDRFRHHTMALFSRHGMSHVGYWTPTEAKDSPNTKLLYILSHASKEAGLKSFETFRADPEWIAAKSASETKAGGSLTVPQPDGVKSIYMKATDFSPIR
jgi:hypothetical protein